MKLGIIQGRLSEPEEGFQECPTQWQREFELLVGLKLNHIEWIITSEIFGGNPIFTEDLRCYPISSVCADFMVDEKFHEPDYLKDFLRPTCEAVRRQGIKHLTIPLLEKSDIGEGEKRKKFIETFSPYVREFSDITFLIEAELHQDKLKEVLDINSSLGVTYDTGNITSCGLDHKSYIFQLQDKIKQVHIKDRTINPLATVPPTQGDTDFNSIFKHLKGINFNGPYTLQTAREKRGNEIETIQKHAKIIRQKFTR